MRQFNKPAAYFHNFLLCYLPGIVFCSVRNLGALVTNVFNIVNSRLMGSLWMVHGICRNLSIYAGNSGTAKLTADTTVCLLGRKKEQILVISLSNTMGNGHLGESMAFRFAQWLALISINHATKSSIPHCPVPMLILNFTIDMLGASCSCSCYPQSRGAISWLDILFHSSVLQSSIEAQ